MDLPIAALAAGAAGWRDAHEAVRSGHLVLPAEVEGPEGPIHAHAAARARDYAREHATALELTPRESVVLWRTYLYAYLRGALDAAGYSLTADPGGAG
jgi:hypothetical protein